MSAQSFTGLVAVAHQFRRDRVAVGLVVDQDAVERVASRGRELQQYVSELIPA